MAITVGPDLLHASGTTRIWEITATADEDVNVVIPHNFGVDPVEFSITPLVPTGTSSQWFLAAHDATSITIEKANVLPGTGWPTPQVRVMARRSNHVIHS